MRIVPDQDMQAIVAGLKGFCERTFAGLGSTNDFEVSRSVGKREEEMWQVITRRGEKEMVVGIAEVGGGYGLSMGQRMGSWDSQVQGTHRCGGLGLVQVQHQLKSHPFSPGQARAVTTLAAINIF
jgi:hypothetical protein